MAVTSKYWRTEGKEEFGGLCDLVAYGKAVVVTGAGASLKLKNRAGEEIPGWTDLLKSIRKDFADRGVIDSHSNTDFENLMRGRPSGAECVEAATILENADRKRFSKLVKKALSPAAWSKQPDSVKLKQQELHEAIFAINPRGLITFNVDGMHEKALRRSRLQRWLRLDPTREGGEVKFRQAIKEIETRPFLLEAHGSLRGGSGIVFTHDQYRQVLQGSPAYGAFMQNLVTNTGFVVVGYGLSDLDFDQFLNTMSHQFGEPLQRHFKITRKDYSDANLRRETHLRRRFGFEFVRLRSFDHIPEVVLDAANTPGPRLRATLKNCLDSVDAKRSAGHRDLRSLGAAGRQIAVRFFLKSARSSAVGIFERTEAIYSLGYLRSNSPGRTDALDRSIWRFLLDLLEQTTHREIAAHALVSIEPFCTTTDCRKLEEIGKRWDASPFRGNSRFPDPDDRLPVYLEALVLRLRAQIVADRGVGALPRRLWRLRRS